MSRHAGEAEMPEVGAAQPVHRSRRVQNWMIVIIAAVGTLQLLYLNYVEADRMFVHRREISRLEREVGAMRAEREALALIAERAGDDAFREQLARRQGSYTRTSFGS